MENFTNFVTAQSPFELKGLWDHATQTSTAIIIPKTEDAAGSYMCSLKVQRDQNGPLTSELMSNEITVKAGNSAIDPGTT